MAFWSDVLYVSLLLVVLLGLFLYGAILTDLFSAAEGTLGQMVLYNFSYLTFWAVTFYVLLWKSSSATSSILKMVGIWLLFAFVIPAAVHQWISIKKPANLMTDLIDAKRDKQQQLYELPDSVLEARITTMFPEIVSSPVMRDSLKRKGAYRRSRLALSNELVKGSLTAVMVDNDAKNELIRASFWFNPISFFQNQLNSISETHYEDYQHYREEVQQMIDQQIRLLVLETWNDSKVDKETYLDYHTNLIAN